MGGVVAQGALMAAGCGGDGPRGWPAHLTTSLRSLSLSLRDSCVWLAQPASLTGRHAKPCTGARRRCPSAWKRVGSTTDSRQSVRWAVPAPLQRSIARRGTSCCMWVLQRWRGRRPAAHLQLHGRALYVPCRQRIRRPHGELVGGGRCGQDACAGLELALQRGADGWEGAAGGCGRCAGMWAGHPLRGGVEHHRGMAQRQGRTVPHSRFASSPAASAALPCHTSWRTARGTGGTAAASAQASCSCIPSQQSRKAPRVREAVLKRGVRAGGGRRAWANGRKRRKRLSPVASCEQLAELE